MPNGTRWSVRNFEPEALDCLWDVAEMSGRTLGDLLSEAVYTWYDGLPVADDPEEAELSTANVQALSELFALAARAMPDA